MAYVREAALRDRGIYGDALRLWLQDPDHPFDEEPLRSRELPQLVEFMDHPGQPGHPDFMLPGLMLLLYKHKARPHPALSDGMLAEIRTALVDFPYHPEEPGHHVFGSWTENHQIGFQVAGYLAGHLYPDDIFTRSGLTGREMEAKYRQRVLRWLRFRFRTGFSEWLSTTYSAIDAAALLSLLECAPDEEIARKTRMVLNVFFLDLALNTREGMLFSTQGRCYRKAKQAYRHQGIRYLIWLAFGRGDPGADAATAAFDLCSRYSIPPVISRLATAYDAGPFVSRQAVGFPVADATRYGLDHAKHEDVFFMLTMEAYFHPLNVNAFVDMMTAWNWWDNHELRSMSVGRDLLMAMRKQGTLVSFAETYEYDVARNCREQANLYTFRSSDYMLSSAQDYRKGMGGDQQHVWQASLGREAVCFTTHPAGLADRSASTPGFWIGSGYLPRVGQVENVAIVIYRAEPPFGTHLEWDGEALRGVEQGPWQEGVLEGVYVRSTLPYTHAWFPKDKFDETAEAGGWVFGRHESGYIALRSQHPYRWRKNVNDGVPPENIDREMIVEGRRNIYLCELGSAAEYGDFASFQERILAASTTFDGLSVAYRSPSQGLLEFGWDGELRKEGVAVPLSGYPRYDNAGVLRAGFPCEEIRLLFQGESLDMVYGAGEGQERDRKSPCDVDLRAAGARPAESCRLALIPSRSHGKKAP